MRKVHRRLMVGAIGAVIWALVGWSVPASAATVQSANLAGVIDCTSLHGAYYGSMRLTGALTGMPPAAQFTGDVKVTESSTSTVSVPLGAPVVADAQGAATLDVTLPGQFVANGVEFLNLYSGTTRVFGKAFYASGCDSGVHVTGRLTADAVCPTRYLVYGEVHASTRRIHGTLGGFVPATPYTFSDPYTSPPTAVSAVADANGAVNIDFTSDAMEGDPSLEVDTPSQTGAAASAPIDSADPCPAMRATWPARPANADVDGDGGSDLVAIDFTGRLLDYPNGSAINPGHLPFSSARVIGSGWGPQYGIRLEALGDLTADSFSEVVTVRSDGTLVAYYNNMNSNPGRMPYSSGTLIGSGWQPFTAITLGDINDDGYADLIARKSDGSVWLYMNHFLSNPGHLPFSTGVPLTVPGLAPKDAFVAVDANADGSADIVSYAGWATLNRLPAGSPQAFIDEKGPQSGVLNGLASYAPRSGWAAGRYDYWTEDAGVVIANPNGDGTLLYLEGVLGSGIAPTTKVIGSGWQAIRQIIN